LDALGMTDNDWVDVSFLWLGADPGPNAVAQSPIPPPPGAAPPPDPPPAPSNPAPAPAPAPPPPSDPAPPAAPAEPPPPPTPQLDNPIIPADAVAVDNDDGLYSRGTHTWETAVCGVNSSHDWAYSTPDSAHTGTWQPDIAPGVYEIKAYIPACGTSIDVGATRMARYVITHDGGTDEVVVDQAAWFGNWVSLGTYYVGGENPAVVQLTAATDDAGSAVVFDTVAWMQSTDVTAPTSDIVSIEREATGFRVTWQGSDDASGVASYDVQVRQLPRGSWRMWVSASDQDSAWFGPDEGKDFAFRVRARDRAANIEPWTEGEDGDMTTIGVAE
jgi:hypothetical protein